MGMRRVHLTMRTEGITAFSNRYGVVVWTGENNMKTISVDANLFENGAKQLRFRLRTDKCGQGPRRSRSTATNESLNSSFYWLKKKQRQNKKHKSRTYLTVSRILLKVLKFLFKTARNFSFLMN